MTVAVVVTVLLGLALRAAWLMVDGRLTPINSEMFNVARAFAQTGQLADAYGPGTGLTAHVSPVMPILAGSVYRLLGVGAPSAEIVLVLISLAMVGLSLVAVDRAMASLSVAWPARLLGLAGALLVPLNLSLELQQLRIWEGSVAAAVLAWVLAIVLRADQATEPTGWRTFLGLSAAGGALALVSPPAALAVYGCTGLLALRRRGLLAFAAVAALSAALLVGFSYPWAVRNEAALGHAVWSRTNFGFNFALGYHDGAVNPADPRAAFLARLEEVDPYTSPKSLAAMKASGGEVAYSAFWTQRTKQWIAEHPAAALQIAGRHLVDYYFPPAWQWNIYSGASKAVALKTALLWLVTALAALGLASRLLGRDWRYLYVLAVIALPATPYILAQPVLRYRYVIATLLMFLAADACWRLGERLARAVTDPGPNDLVSRLLHRRMPTRLKPKG